MAISIVQTPYSGTKSTTISVRPFIDSDKINMGLERYGMILFDGVFHEEQLACIERNGVKRYITGLNEFAPEVKLIKDDEQREAKIKDIRETVAQLERELAANIIDPKDPDFWNKVKLLRPDNDEFWGQITIRCGNDPVILDPAKEPWDLVKLYAIEANGFAMVASSLEKARSQAVPPKFYLDKEIDTVATRTELTKLRNKAITMLEELSEKNPKKLLYVAKVVDGNSTVYRKSTPKDLIYENMDRYIQGEGVENNQRRAISTFIKTAELDMENLKIKAMVKDAHFYKFVVSRSDGFIYYINGNENVQMGRNISDCVEYLKNPLHDDILVKLSEKIESYWNK